MNNPNSVSTDSLTIKGHEVRASDSPFVEAIGRIPVERAYSPLCPADGHWNLLLVKLRGKTSLSVWGPMTIAAEMPYVEGAEFMYIQFKLGVYMPKLPPGERLDAGTTLPDASSQSVWLNGAAWQFPDFENADTFVARLIRDGLLVHEPVVDAVLNDQPPHLSIRSAQRRFRQATGLTQRYFQTIERARRAAVLLQQGVSILDTIYELGYVDQPHLTKSLKRFIGFTPVEIARLKQVE